jgi:hypothetical protein
VILNVFTIIPAVAFVAIELFRDTKADGGTQEKTKVENIVEGVIFLLLVLAWIPTVGAVTTPNGAASLIGNTYFFSKLLPQKGAGYFVLCSDFVYCSISQLPCSVLDCMSIFVSMVSCGLPL